MCDSEINAIFYKATIKKRKEEKKMNNKKAKKIEKINEYVMIIMFVSLFYIHNKNIV